MTELTKRLAAVAALLSLAGCGGLADAASDAEAPAATPAETLTKGVPTSSAEAFHYAIKGGVQPLIGVVDAGHKAMTTEISEKIPDGGFTLTMKFMVIGDDSWAHVSFGSAPASLGLPKLPKKWMKLDPKKLGDDASKDLTYTGQTDPGYVSALITAATGLTESSAGHYAGTVDLTKVTEAEIVDKDTLTALGAKAAAVPFEAVLDAKGRISTATVKIPAAGKTKAATYQVTYDQYGSAESPATPAAADQVAAPKAAYDLLNG
ncbi:hypothetical protein [Actinoplanes sp. L3-i22]|uniref:hypothetical protein n=1 Tax=Actinoplanes sp. L3-i22 TaxID=2836373 RepID=UPI001C754BBA|nr:hypothetical protein [Actinoplanes sp. L3-i22]BCY06052.1 hypothetical protein L3i22_011400 [Actinoplanes sp. L3-i22]